MGTYGVGNRLLTGTEKNSLWTIQSAMRRMGPSEAVERFLGKYGNLQTKAAYSFALARYFEWLRAKMKNFAWTSSD